MWTVEAREIIGLQGAGGEPFAHFLNALIRANCYLSGIPDSSVSTTARQNFPDGGVDAAVHVSTMASTAGRFQVPTAWQFKGTSSGLVKSKLKEEIGKYYSKELIEKGYSYRLCVCDDLQDVDRTEWLSILNAEAKSFNRDAPAVEVLTVSDLAGWANRFPSMVGTVFARPLTLARHWGAWQTSETRDTPEYSLPDGWEPNLLAIKGQVDFSTEPSDSILTVQGAAGVGKTRLVFEAIRQSSGASQFAIITDDEDQAIEAAHWLVNKPEAYGILIADECPVEGRERLRKKVRGFESRIRVVAIDNAGQPTPGGAPSIWLETISIGSVRQILARNFGPAVPDDRRRRYADISGGYVRLAADLCRHDHDIFSTGSLTPAFSNLNDYYLSRLNEADRLVVEAVSLVHRLGCDDDVAEELKALDRLTGIPAQTVLETVQRLKNSPGFIARTARYIYVTPQIIADIAFRHAWSRWAEANPSSFLNKLPAELLTSFETRVQGITDEGVRSFVSGHFRDRVANFCPADLADHDKVTQLLGLLEIDPSTYLALLERLIRESSNDDLLAHAGSFGRRGTRRGIVWAVERLACFPGFFSSAEYVLRRLALAESEPRIGNNASGIWRQLFRVWLSGASVPFMQRLSIYRPLLFSPDVLERDLALGAFDHIWDSMVTRMSSPSIIAGRIPPEDWQPTSQAEWDECFDALFNLLNEMLRSGGLLADRAWRYLANHLRTLLSHRHLDRLRSLVAAHPVPVAFTGEWFEQLDDALRYECFNSVDAPADLATYCEKVRAWKSELQPQDFAGRLRTIVGKDVWHHMRYENGLAEESELKDIAAELQAAPELLSSNMAYLCSPEARSAVSLGLLIGEGDSDGAHFDEVLIAARKSRNTEFLRGYTSGLLTAAPRHAAKANQVIDSLERDDSPLAFELVRAALDLTDPGPRIVRMIRADSLGFESLLVLLYGDTLAKMSESQFENVLSIFDAADIPAQALKVASDIIAARLRHQGENSSPISESESIVRHMLAILARSATLEINGDVWWDAALVKLANVMPAEVARVAGSAIRGEDYSKRQDGIKILTILASKKPEVVMAEVGRELLDSETGWAWRIASQKGIFATLPVDVVMRWVDETGIERARRVARHLPSPFVGADGVPDVPPITEQLLTRYGSNEDVFREFSTSRHQFEVTWGNPSDVEAGRARIAEFFVNHPSDTIRRWARNEAASSRYLAARWKKDEEDHGFRV